MSEIEDRRQRAYEAYADMIVGDGVTGYPAKRSDCVEYAIEVATRVQITDEIWERLESFAQSETGAEQRQRARQLFEAAGFEVVE